uniref:ERCC4 domain-containing protein n=1 Tax=viral metagenome TaxID=1070528 RepID=A0A6C0JH89_9ZZZZ
MIIKLDFREKELEEKITELQYVDEKYGKIKLIKENLPLGDIIICDDSGKELVIVERKTIRDLASSIRDGRYKEQSYRLNNCNLHNHSIYYLIEGNILTFKPSRYGRQPVTWKAIISSLTSISYNKGFSIYKSINCLESAMWLLQMTDKLSRTKEKYFYLNENIKTNGSSDYVAVSKRVKKDNINENNIGAIMLSQIPGVSTASATVIMNKYKNIDILIDALRKNEKALNDITTLTKSGKPRKITKTCCSNVYNYLISDSVKSIDVLND